MEELCEASLLTPPFTVFNSIQLYISSIYIWGWGEMYSINKGGNNHTSFHQINLLLAVIHRMTQNLVLIHYLKCKKSKSYSIVCNVEQ